MDLNIVQLAPLGANCVLIANDMGHLAIIDPGGEPEKVIRFVNTHQYKPEVILLTHGHFDHIGAAQELKTKYDVPVYIHANDKQLLAQANVSTKYFGIEDIVVPAEIEYLSDGDIIPLGNIDLRVFHTPGHSPGSVCFYVEQVGLLVSGDTLFLDAVGRTDLTAGNANSLKNSIQTRLYTLPDETIVIPGHGGNTTIGYEANNNPYVRR